MNKQRANQKKAETKQESKFAFSQMMDAGNELLHQLKTRSGLHDIYDITDAPSVLGFTLKTATYLPMILWKMREYDSIKSQRFWYKNKKNEIIEGIMYGPEGEEPLPLVALDSGYRRDLFNFSIVGKVIACLGYRAFSVRSHNELKGMEADDYMEGMEYIRTKYDRKEMIGKDSAVVGISGGNIVVYRSCSSRDFVERHSVKCAISIAPFADLEEQFKHMKKTLKKPDIPQNVRKVLEDYDQYVESLGVSGPGSDPSLFKNGSPVTYCKDMLVGILNIHGINDKIVPATGSLKIHKEMQKNGKGIETIITPGEGIHGDLSKWKKEIIPTLGLGASIVYAYRFLKNQLKR